ncbi:WGR domain-containing protein [Aminobacter sp. MET-1]|uniref:WGR domain-containing protein n=1 Tax=Aminobacter sp. MET-1 TaxID=2951085 RepID=UPI00226A89CA|nr:WGR domain-containing protein [Aminobacter sp. MET-1]MCX8570813.1 WGR domain-containing protein [Aminobacter sp. MET-1]
MLAPLNDIHLHRVDPALNMRRFYSLTLQPTLFGGVSVIRNWGRIGANGQVMIETFDGPDEAHRALRRLETMKKRRGYCVPGAEQLQEFKGSRVSGVEAERSS